VSKLKARIFDLETKLQKQSVDRNANYYKTIIREFFPSQTEIYKEDIGDHECFCNCCGEDIGSKAQNLADQKFSILKQDFE
jgi:hypothetical protein